MYIANKQTCRSRQEEGVDFSNNIIKEYYYNSLSILFSFGNSKGQDFFIRGMHLVAKLYMGGKSV